MKINPNQHYQRGFIQVPLILFTIAILTAVGIGGNYYIKNNHSETSDIATSTEEVINSQPIIEEKEEILIEEPKQQTKKEVEPKQEEKGLTLAEILAKQEPQEDTSSLQKEKAKQEVLYYLNEDIDTLNDILKEIINSRERYIDYATKASNQRKQSLSSLLPLAPDTSLRDFIQKGVDDQQNRLNDIRNDYETSFGFIEDGLKDYVDRITFVRDEFEKGIETEDFTEYYFGADGQIDRFINLLQEVNSMASNREKMYAEAYTKYLGYINSLNSTYQTGYSIASKLSEIENKISQEPENFEIRCWATTESVNGILSGDTQTFIRCE